MLNFPQEILPRALVEKVHAFIVGKMLLPSRRHERKPLLLKSLHPQELVEPMRALPRRADLRRRVAVAVEELAGTPVLAEAPSEVHARPPPKSAAFLQVSEERRIIYRTAPPVERVGAGVLSVRENQRITPPTRTHDGIHRRVVEIRQLAPPTAAVKIVT